MHRFILGRLAQAVVTVLLVSVIVFMMTRLSGSPVNLMLPPDATEQDRVAMEKRLGLDRPLHEQYGMFMANAIRGDLGKSVRTGRPTLEMVLERFPATIQLSLAAMVLSLLISLPVGVYSAVRREGLFDFLARTFAVLGQSVPSFLVGILLMYGFAVFLRLLPASGQGGPQNLILPSVTLGWAIAAGIMRLTRSSMLEVLGTDYVKLARIKGVSEFKIVWGHAFKNAALPVVTYSSMILAIILGGAVVTETVFAWPGVGRMVVEAVSQRDFPVVQTAVMVLSVIFILTNFLVDVSYCYLNPKIRYGNGN